MSVHAGPYYYCLHKCAEQLVWLAQGSLSASQHMQTTYKLHKHCWSSKLATDFLEEGTF